jgi:hypothetical protein
MDGFRFFQIPQLFLQSFTFFSLKFWLFFQLRKLFFHEAHFLAIYFKLLYLILQFFDDNWIFLPQLIDFLLCNFNVIAKVGSISIWECLYFINCFIKSINFYLFCFFNVLFDKCVNEYELVISKLISIILIFEYCSVILDKLCFRHWLSILSLLARSGVLTEFSEA